ncbi:MAG: DUF5723 family protein [Balneolaceae bacterium]
MSNIKSGISLSLIILAFLFPARLLGQISLNPESMGLGGGGTAYLTGYEALFVNPANLYIREKSYRLQFSMLQGGAYFDTPLAIRNVPDRFSTYTESLQPVFSVQSNRLITGPIREQLVNRNYPGNRQIKKFQSLTDFYWFGLKWTGQNRNYAVALRTRTSSRYELGRGLFDPEPFETEDMLRINQSFNHQYQTLHELSFGYAESFTFLNGLMPQLSEFIIGIAPKIVVSGASLDVNYLDRYEYEQGADAWNRTQEYNQQSTGYFSSSNRDFLQQQNTSDPNLPSASFEDLLRPAGIGFGLDIGLTYLITFGDDLSTLQREDSQTEKSLRFSFSITDLGAVHQYKTPLSYQNNQVVDQANQPGQVSDLQFLGAPNEHLFFLNQNSPHPLSSSQLVSDEAFESLLPTTVQSGVLFQINRIKLMGDFSYALSSTAFKSSGLRSYLGLELRPLPFLPLRAGTRLASNSTGYYSFGTGIDTKYVNLSAAIQLRSRSVGPTTEILGASVVGLKIYIP